MIVGIGSDLCNIERIQNSLDRFGERFLNRVFTQTERKKAESRPHTTAGTLAKRFAAKEAISKALGTGLHGLAWREMEIVQLRSGRPTVTLHGNARRRAEFLGLGAFDVSIADLAEFSIAVAVAVQTSLPTS